MNTFKCRVVNHNLPEEVRVAIFTTPLVHRTPEEAVRHIQRRADRKGINATYSVATQEEYDAHYEHIRGGEQ